MKGYDAVGIAKTEAGQFMKCPRRREWFDMRDLRPKTDQPKLARHYG
jgi:hypothetical protein